MSPSEDSGDPSEPPSPQEQWKVRLRHDLRPLRPWRLRTWSANITHGIAICGEPGADIWRAHDREHLLRKVFRFIERESLRLGVTQAPLVEIDNLDGRSRQPAHPKP